MSAEGEMAAVFLLHVGNGAGGLAWILVSGCPGGLACRTG